jgi:hypothetical protein
MQPFLFIHFLALKIKAGQSTPLCLQLALLDKMCSSLSLAQSTVQTLQLKVSLSLAGT